MITGKTISIFTITIFVIGIFVLHTSQDAFASETDGTISNGSTYAWGENLGWVNFKPTHGGLYITDTTLSGYAWSQNNGWINFAPSGGGVHNTTSGQLSGYAWSSTKGWINFSGVSIDNQGKFSGTAGTLGDNAGRINFNCTNCDVRTDWRPLSARTVITPTQQSGVIGGSSIMAVSPIAVMPLITLAEDIPLLLLPEVAGKVTLHSDAGPIIVEIPQGAHHDPMTLTINIIKAPEVQDHPPLQDGFLLNAAFYEIRSVDSHGNEVHTFNAPLRITLPLPQSLRDVRRLGVYWLNTTNNTWIKIPNALFTNDHVEFSVTHLTRFAIFATRSTAAARAPVLVPSPGGGAIVAEKQNVDIFMQNIDIERERIVRERTERATLSTGSPVTTHEEGLTIIAISTLIALILHILARRKSTE